MTVRSRGGWTDQHKIPRRVIPCSVMRWLEDGGSLTQRLIQLCGDEFQVKLLSECRQRPRLDESQALGMDEAGQARVRQVLLCAGDTPLVYARTVIPLTTMQGPARRLAYMGNRPLGAVLFASRGMRRGPLEITRQRAERLNSILPKSEVWGRRSLFYLAGRPLLVGEFFLPSLFERVSERGIENDRA